MRLPTIFRKAVPVRSQQDAPEQPHVFYLDNGIGVAVVQYAEYIAMEQALRHPIVYRALNKIAESVQQVRWVVQLDSKATKAEQSGKTTQIRDLQNLLDNPNPDMTPAMLRYWLGLNYAGYGRAPFKIAFSAINKEQPTGIYPLEARLVRAIINKRGTVEKYIYGTTENEQTWPAKSEWNKNSASGYAHQIWKPGLKGYQSRDDVNNPLQAIGLPSMVIKALLIRAIKTAEGHPNVRYMVTCSKTLTANQLAAIKKHLSHDATTGGADSGSIPVLQNAADIEIHKLDNDLSDIHSKVPSDDMARLIFGAFGIPLAVSGIGASDAAKFTGNFSDSRLSFWQDTIIPAYIEPLFQGLTSILCPPGLQIVGDYDSIPAMMEGRIKSMRDVSFVSFLTTSDKRALFGFAPTNLLPETPYNSGAEAGAAKTGADANGVPDQENQNDPRS